MVTLYEFPVSPFCDKIRRVLHAKGVPYRSEKVPLMSTLGAYRRVNPTGKVPCMTHEGKTIGDSTAIAHYLDAAFPDPPLRPSDPTERALCDVLEDWADESLYFYQKRLKFTIAANAEHWTEQFSTFDTRTGKTLLGLCLVWRQTRQLHEQGLGRKTIEAVMVDIERHAASVAALVAEREWLVGDALSLADIAVCAQLTSLRQSPEGAAVLDRHLLLTAWMARVDARTSRPLEDARREPRGRRSEILAEPPRAAVEPRP